MDNATYPRIKAIIIGCGFVGTNLVRMASEKGVDFIGGFARTGSKKIGTDLGEISHMAKTGVLIQDWDNLDEFVHANRVDTAIHTPANPISKSVEQVKTCLRNGVNVLTSLADVYVMRKDEPALFAELDALAKANDATFVASGIQDVFWTALPVALSGCCVEAQGIMGRNVAFVDGFGPGVADECFVGWDYDDFKREVGEAPLQNDFLIALYELADVLGLHALSESSKMEPLFAEQDMYCAGIDRHIRKGQLRGNYVESRIKTQEGVDLACQFVSTVSVEGLSEENRWTITGTPTINIITEQMQGEITTESNMLNRIPDVINAAPGVISAGYLPAPYFKVHPLGSYVK